MGKKVALGFDFGTYTTKISFLPVDKKTNPEILQISPYSDESSGFVYSFVSKDFSKIGYPAYQEYKKGNDDGIVYGFKMGLDSKENYEIAKIFLKTIFEKAIEILKARGYEVDLENVRFSAPNSWVEEENERFLKLLQDIGAIKDYKSGKRIVEREPYASAVYHIKDFEKAGEKALVIDAGAGTIDTVLVEIKDNGLEEVKGSYKTIEKAGRYIDQKIKEFYKLQSMFEAEKLKFLISYKFLKGEDKVSERDYYVEKQEFENECMKEWIGEYKNLLNQYKKYEPNYILFAGGSSAFYLVREIAKIIFPKAKEYDTSKGGLSFAVSQNFREDKSISYGCSIIASNKINVKETLKFEVYLKLESFSVIESFTYEDKPVYFSTGKLPGEYILQLFSKDDYIGRKVSLSNYKRDGEPLKVSSFGSMKIVIDYTNKRVEKELPIKNDRFRATILSNLKFEVDLNKVFKVIYEYEDGTTEVLTSTDLRTV